MLKSFLISFILTGCFIITVHNINEAKASLDRCETLIQEIEDQAEYLKILETYYNI